MQSHFWNLKQIFIQANYGTCHCLVKNLTMLWKLFSIFIYLFFFFPKPVVKYVCCKSKHSRHFGYFLSAQADPNHLSLLSWLWYVTQISVLSLRLWLSSAGFPCLMLSQRGLLCYFARKPSFSIWLFAPLILLHPFSRLILRAKPVCSRFPSLMLLCIRVSEIPGTPHVPLFGVEIGIQSYLVDSLHERQ